jgi:hypothetical protein
MINCVIVLKVLGFSQKLIMGISVVTKNGKQGQGNGWNLAKEKQQRLERTERNGDFNCGRSFSIANTNRE